MVKGKVILQLRLLLYKFNTNLKNMDNPVCLVIHYLWQYQIVIKILLCLPVLIQAVDKYISWVFINKERTHTLEGDIITASLPSGTQSVEPERPQYSLWWNLKYENYWSVIFSHICVIGILNRCKNSFADWG